MTSCFCCEKKMDGNDDGVEKEEKTPTLVMDPHVKHMFTEWSRYTTLCMDFILRNPTVFTYRLPYFTYYMLACIGLFTTLMIASLGRLCAYLIHTLIDHFVNEPTITNITTLLTPQKDSLSDYNMGLHLGALLAYPVFCLVSHIYTRVADWVIESEKNHAISVASVETGVT